MITLTPISITATVQQYCATITESLCQPFCLGQTVQPVPSVNYSLAGINVVNGTAYATIQCIGSVQYMPKNYCGCCPQTRKFVESFEVAFEGVGTPTIAITQESGVSAPANVKCNGNAYAYSITSNVTITATFPA